MTEPGRVLTPRLCTCGCGKRTDAAYWHAWQAGRAKGWNEGYGRPYWWMRFCYLTGEAWFRLTHRKANR